MITVLHTNITIFRAKYPDICAWAFIDILGGAGILLLYPSNDDFFRSQYTQPIPLPTGVLSLHGYYD